MTNEMDFMNKEEEKCVVDPKLGNFGTIQDDEINLYNLWKAIVKRKMTIIAIFLISLIGAMLYVFTSPEIYRLEAHMKLYLPKDWSTVRELPLTTVRELPTAKDLSSIIGTLNPEKKAIIFSKGADKITNVKIDELKGATDKFKITIESQSPEMLPEALENIVKYIENMNMIKNNYEKITRELDEKIKDIKETYAKSDLMNREIEKRIHSSKMLSVGFNPIEVNEKVLEMKIQLYRLEQERRNYKLIQPLDDPFISKYPVKPYKTLIITIAAICSLMVGVFIAVIAEYLERVRKKTVSIV